MTWADFYLVCFAAGFLFSFLSFVMGGFHWHLPFHIHLPGSVDPHFHVHAGSTHHAGAPASADHNGRGTTASVVNPLTIAIFLAWFGGTGYLLTRYSSILVVGALSLSVLAGLVGAAIVFLFLSKVLTSSEESLDPADFEMVGVLGRLSIPIREGGTGELIYSQAGTRRTCGARSENATVIAKGTEVIVTRYEKGIAYVRPWEEMAGEEESGGGSQ
jgi:membrane protein implicated in regulation of membrane protease activity